MKEQDKDLMERYIYQVIKRLDKNQRDEIALELRELIEEMAEDSTMEQVLEKLGEPAVFARQYRDGKDYLIGPEYYDNYIWVMKIVLICVLASVAVSAVISCMLNGNWRELPKDMLGEAVFSLAASIGFVTLVFTVMEHQQVKVDIGKGAWEPKQLEPLPDKKALISRSDSIVSLVFIVLFGGVLVLAPQMLGAYVFDGGEFVRSIPILNLEKWNVILPVLLPGLFIGFVDEMIRLVSGRYCKVVMISNIISNIIQLVLSIIALKVLPFWNPDFLEDVRQAFDRKAASKGDIFFYYGTDLFSNIVLGIMCIAMLCEVGITIYKSIRYGNDKI